MTGEDDTQRAPQIDMSRQRRGRTIYTGEVGEQPTEEFNADDARRKLLESIRNYGKGD